MQTFTSKYSIGEVVYLVTDEMQSERLVSEVGFKGSGATVYAISFGSEISYHYDFEISAQKNLFKQLSINDKSEQS